MANPHCVLYPLPEVFIPTLHTTISMSKATGTNQHLPCLPHSSVFTVRRRCKEWGLESTRRQKHTVESIATLVDEVKMRFPNHGAETIRKALLMENKIRSEPDAVEAWWYKKFKRRTFVAIGPNEMWCLNQHDKFKRYGLFFHVGLDPFLGVIHWCKVWWTSDLGMENVNVAYAQTALRHCMESSLNGSIQHRWYHWSVRFQALLDRGVDEGYYDIGDPLECLVFRFVFIPFIQKEVDAWVHQRNWTKRCADHKKVLPNGIPMLFFQKPHEWKAADYKVAVPSETFNEIEQKYAPPNDPIFDLVPHTFAVHANAIWTDMRSPEPEFRNVWEIYLHIRDALRSMAWDEAFRHSLSAASQPEQYPEELPVDLRPDEDELLVVDVSDNATKMIL
ncbi:hypothetical protein EI94DRAFT_1773282 [Lactarius quietus]|nr:hypothetical protein EI94DRAFT_1773282 [Lactarius quietus]